MTGFGDEDPFNPAATSGAANQANRASPQPVGRSVHPCNNWIDVIAYDEATGKPIKDLPYKVFDVESDSEIAKGKTDGSDVPQSHCIADKYKELAVFFGTDAAISEARNTLKTIHRDRQLAALQQPTWNGIRAGLAREEFEREYIALIQRTGTMISPRISILEMSWYGWGSVYDRIVGGAEYSNREFLLLNIRLCWEEYQLVTGSRTASAGASLYGGAGNGLTFGFGDEFAAWLDSIIEPDKTYAQILAERQRIQDLERVAHPNYFLTGEIAGMIPTIFIPVGGAAAASARGAATTTGAMARGGLAAAGTAFGLGSVEGFGNARGDAITRLREALKSGTYAAVGGLVLAGLGTLLVRTVARRVAVARIALRPFWRPSAQQDIVAWLGKGIKNHPLREAYEKAVPERVGRIAREVRENMSDAELEQIARRAMEMRRSIGVEFKDVTPSPLIDYIREVNMERYKDALGPSFDMLAEKFVSRNPGASAKDVYRSIIDSAQRPNADIDKLLAGFDTWLSTKPDDFIRRHWEALAPKFGSDPGAISDIVSRIK